jgi:hypothetical protein
MNQDRHDPIQRATPLVCGGAIEYRLREDITRGSYLWWKQRNVAIAPGVRLRFVEKEYMLIEHRRTSKSTRILANMDNRAIRSPLLLPLDASGGNPDPAVTQDTTHVLRFLWSIGDSVLERFSPSLLSFISGSLYFFRCP